MVEGTLIDLQETRAACLLNPIEATYQRYQSTTQQEEAAYTSINELLHHPHDDDVAPKSHINSTPIVWNPIMRNNAYMLVSMPSIPEIHDTKCMTTSNNNTADWKHSNWIPAVIISAWKPTMYCNATFCSLVFKKFDVSMCEPVMDCSVCHVQVETLWSKIVTIDQYVAVQNNTTLRFEYDSVTKATGISLDYQTFAEMNVTIESIQLTSTHILLFMQLSLELQTEIFMQARTQMMSQSLLCMQIQYSSCSDQSRLLCSNFNKDDKDNNNRQNYAMLKNDAINTNANVSLNLIFDFCKGADSKLMMSSQDLLATFTLQSKMKASVRYAVISAIIVNEESITKMDLKKPVNQPPTSMS